MARCSASSSAKRYLTMSPIEMMPLSWPSSTTGTWRIRWSVINSIKLLTVYDRVQVTNLVVMCCETASSSAAAPRCPTARAMSRSSPRTRPRGPSQDLDTATGAHATSTLSCCEDDLVGIAAVRPRQVVLQNLCSDGLGASPRHRAASQRHRGAKPLESAEQIE